MKSQPYDVDGKRVANLEVVRAGSSQEVVVSLPALRSDGRVVSKDMV